MNKFLQYLFGCFIGTGLTRLGLGLFGEPDITGARAGFLMLLAGLVGACWQFWLIIREMP